MAAFSYDEAHFNGNPPRAVVKGLLTATDGDYEVQFYISNSNTIFAGPVSVNVNQGFANVNAPIAECTSDTPPNGLRTAQLVAAHRRSGAETWTKEVSRAVNYRCK